MNITGKIHEIGTTIQVTDSFKKREFVVVVADNPQYPEYIKFELGQDKCSLADSLRVGDTVDVYFNLRGRPWTDKAGKKSYFNSLQAWKVDNKGGGQGSGYSEYSAPKITPADEDDLPF